MSGLESSFQYEEKNCMVVEALEEYILASVEVAYEEPGEKAPMGLMTSWGEFPGAGNESYW